MLDITIGRESLNSGSVRSSVLSKGVNIRCSTLIHGGVLQGSDGQLQRLGEHEYDSMRAYSDFDMPLLPGKHR